jgi:hypothetical protein
MEKIDKTLIVGIAMLFLFFLTAGATVLRSYVGNTPAGVYNTVHGWENLLLLGSGLICIAGWGRRKFKK